jgi:iron complex outermembrane receptor protein
LISEKWVTMLSVGLGVHNNQVDNPSGIESLKIFYPDMPESRSRLLPRVATSAQYQNQDWQFAAGLAYGERAPSVSEGYGFYLFDSFDRFDYVGNPEMKNEKSIEPSSSISYTHSQLSAKLTCAFFHLRDYIIGRPHPELSVMTIGASGVKIYEQTDHADILNGTLDVKYHLSERWLLSGNIVYRRGTAAGVGNLPLMQPFTYSTGVIYAINAFAAEAHLIGAAEQHRFNPELGETPAPAYRILNLSASYQFALGAQSATTKAGCENVFDKYYSTFADWNRIPRFGRNVYINLLWNF